MIACAWMFVVVINRKGMEKDCVELRDQRSQPAGGHDVKHTGTRPSAAQLQHANVHST